ncbi:MAG: hypothetical protein O9264_17430 [Leptospira sp.]|nr:hypothetical protein [Leptospira sp.]
MELSKQLIDPLLILSESEVYFLKTVVPILLVLPWALAVLYFLIRFLVRWIASLMPKPKELFETTSIALPPAPKMDELPRPKLKDIETLAQTNPRLAIFELSRYVRMNGFEKSYEILSLEAFLQDTVKKSKKAKSLNLLSTEMIAKLQAPHDLYAKIVLSAYQVPEPTTEIVMEYLSQVRGFKTKAKGKKQ